MDVTKQTYNPKWTAILIVGFFLTGILIGNYVQRFRISEYRCIYQYGSYLNLIMVVGSLFWSFIHPLAVWSYTKPEWKKHLIWIIVGLLPLIFFITMMIIAEIRFGNKITWA